MVIAMTERGFVIVLNVGIFVLLLILVMEAAGIRRSLRRIEREERGLVARTRLPYARLRRDSAARAVITPCFALAKRNGRRLDPALLSGSGSGTCSNCGPYYHRFFTQKGCEGALAEYNVALNEQRGRLATGFDLEYGIGVLGKCEAHPLRH